MDQEIASLSDAIYRDKVLRARTLSVSERVDTAIELFEGAVGLMKDGIRAQFPDYDEEVEQAIRQETDEFSPRSCMKT